VISGQRPSLRLQDAADGRHGTSRGRNTGLRPGGCGPGRTRPRGDARFRAYTPHNSTSNGKVRLATCIHLSSRRMRTPPLITENRISKPIFQPAALFPTGVSRRTTAVGRLLRREYRNRLHRAKTRRSAALLRRSNRHSRRSKTPAIVCRSNPVGSQPHAGRRGTAAAAAASLPAADSRLAHGATERGCGAGRDTGARVE